MLSNHNSVKCFKLKTFKVEQQPLALKIMQAGDHLLFMTKKKLAIIRSYIMKLHAAVPRANRQCMGRSETGIQLCMVYIEMIHHACS